MLKNINYLIVIAIIALSTNSAFADFLSSNDRQVRRMDEYLSKNVMFQAIKQVDPREYENFRVAINGAIKAGKSQNEANALAGKFMNDFLMKRLRYATDPTLRQYLTYRADLISKLEKISPNTCYDLLINGGSFDSLPSEMQEKMLGEQEMLFAMMADIIVAPLRNKPAPQNKALTEKWIAKIGNTLSAEELEALGNERSPNVNKIVYCRAFNKVYRKGLQLPTEKMVQVFRELGEIP